MYIEAVTVVGFSGAPYCNMLGLKKKKEEILIRKWTVSEYHVYSQITGQYCNPSCIFNCM